MVELAEIRDTILQGTINAAGTLSAQIDSGGFPLNGLISDANLLNTTLSFQVSAYPESHASKLFIDLVDASGNTVQFGPTGSPVAISSDDVVQALAAYRYIKIKTAIAQTNGVKFYLPARAT